jgi:uncharacterized protein
VSEPLIALAAFLTAAFGAVGGMGGAVLLVPILAVTGTDVAAAAPLGLLSVAGGSLAAAARHLEERTVNHRMAVSLEVFASAGAVVGAIVAGRANDELLRYGLALVAAAAAIANLVRRGLRNRPVPGFPASAVGEWRGELAGAYLLDGEVVPYRASRLPVALGAIAGSGFVAGVSGVSGGFIKTPVMTDVMRVPIKVSAPTTTFTVGVTASTALIVFALQDRLDLHLGAVVLAASIVGGAAGARLQAKLSPPVVRRLLSALLLAVSLVLVVST